MSELLTCPLCGGEVHLEEIEPHKHLNGILPDHPGSWFIECSCGVGIIGEDRQDVIDRWNRRHIPEARQLTLDELRQMNGQPTWKVTERVGLRPAQAHWTIIEKVKDNMVYHAYGVCEYEGAKFYNRPPGGDGQ
jgi:hypothetical protein